MTAITERKTRLAQSTRTIPMRVEVEHGQPVIAYVGQQRVELSNPAELRKLARLLNRAALFLERGRKAQ